MSFSIEESNSLRQLLEKEKLEQEKKILNLSKEEIKSILKLRINEEEAPNLQSVIEKISLNFNKAQESSDQNEIKNCLSVIENYLNYLHEKYQDSSDQKEYLRIAERAVELLKAK